MGWLKQALTGADNETVAIGRLIGFAIALVLLIGLPVTAAATIIIGVVKVETWASFMTALQVYVPLVVAAIGGLVWGTNSTEPPPRRDAMGENPPTPNS
jgi:hypothetical protein